MSFFRTRTFVFSISCAGAFARLYIVHVVKTAGTNKKGPASGIYGRRGEEVPFRSKKFHSLKRTIHFRACIASTKLKLQACNLVALLKIAITRQPRKIASKTLMRYLFLPLHDDTLSEMKLWKSARENFSLHCAFYSYSIAFTKATLAPTLGHKILISSCDNSAFGWKMYSSANRNNLF